MTAAAYYWWEGGLQAPNGIQVQYANESQQCQWFASDDYGSNLPTLTINYVTDTTAPTASASRYYYAYNGHGDTVALVDVNGNAVDAYAYDPFGVVSINTESFANGWHNPYLYDGRDGARYDGETGLYWLSVRAYDPTLGRFLARDPLGRKPAAGGTGMPYVYCADNPLTCADPGGEYGHGIEEDGNLVGYYTHPRPSITPPPPPPPHVGPCGHPTCPPPPKPTTPGGHGAPKPVAHVVAPGHSVGGHTQGATLSARVAGSTSNCVAPPARTSARSRRPRMTPANSPRS